MWGKYDKKTEGMISVFKIPLSFITKFLFDAKELTAQYSEKILKIPSIKIKNNNIKTFSIGIKGYVNNPETFELELNRIKTRQRNNRFFLFYLLQTEEFHCRAD